MSILKNGLKGAPVKRLQIKLGVTADGEFGPGTEKALKEFQKTKGLTVDGVAGPDTFAAIGLPELILLRKGVKGAQVKKLQEALGISADGAFGPGTEKAVKAFQEQNGLTADGVAGPETLAKMDAFDTITAETVAAACVKPDEEVFEGEALPELNDNAIVGVASSSAPNIVAPGKSPDHGMGKSQSSVEKLAQATIAPAEEKSVWSKVKGWF